MTHYKSTEISLRLYGTIKYKQRRFCNWPHTLVPAWPHILQSDDVRDFRTTSFCIKGPMLHPFSYLYFQPRLYRWSLAQLIIQTLYTSKQKN